MSYRRLAIPLASATPGVSAYLVAHCFGSDPYGKSAYLHAGLHGDEHPGMLVLQHLLEQLKALDAGGEIPGYVTVVPYANPIGMAQRLFGPVIGRFDFENGENFNRNFPLLDHAVEDALTRGPALDRRGWKACFSASLSDCDASTAAAAMKLELARLAMQHDIVLDLHCDTECVAHVYAAASQASRAIGLAETMRAPVVLIEPRNAGGGAFDQTHSSAWGTLQAAGVFTEDEAGFSATLELRGQADVNDELAASDSHNLVRYLQRENIVAGGNSRLAADTSRPLVFPLEGASHVPVPCAGIIVYRKEPGDAVATGEVIAEIVKLDGDGFNERVPVHSTVDGVLIVRQWQRLVRPGQRAALLAGATALAGREAGNLLLDF